MLKEILKDAQGVPTGNYKDIAGGTLYADNPIGTILPYGGTAAPAGWFLCQGQALSRTTYADLFSVIGTSFGAGDGSTTFNIPDLRGEFLRGAGTNSRTTQGSGGTVGQHQDATEHVNNYVFSYNLIGVHVANTTTGSMNANVKNIDKETAKEAAYIEVQQSNKNARSQYTAMYASRPTNTSVNYIIKAKQTPLPTDLEAGVENYINEKQKGILEYTLDANQVWRNYDTDYMVLRFVDEAAGVDVRMPFSGVVEGSATKYQTIGFTSSGAHINLYRGTIASKKVYISTDAVTTDTIQCYGCDL